MGNLTGTDINKITGITNGTAAANKALVVDSNIDITGIRNITITGSLTASGSTTLYGGMYFNANGTAQEIETASIPIALRYFTTGSLNGFTFDAGSTSGITSYQVGTGGASYTRVNSVGHSLSSGAVISIRGSSQAAQNGIHTISSVSTDYFDIDVAWTSDGGASDWDEPSHLIAGASSAGTYKLAYAVSASEGGGAGSVITYCAYVNATAQNTTRIQRKFANNDVGAFPGIGLVAVTANSKIFLTANSNGTNALTHSYGNFTLEKF